jgi:hypothetical protein
MIASNRSRLGIVWCPRSSHWCRRTGPSTIMFAPDWQVIWQLFWQVDKSAGLSLPG